MNSKWRLWVFMSMVLCLMGFAALATGCGVSTPETGWHRGQITDVSEAGLFCDTYEGQIMTGTGNSAIAYNFTITSKEVFEELREAQARSIPVNLHYTSSLFYSLCSSLNGNFVDRLEIVGVLPSTPGDN
jgi:hypothetical protein